MPLAAGRGQLVPPIRPEPGEAHALELGARGEVLVASEGILLAARDFTTSQELTLRRLHPHAA